MIARASITSLNMRPFASRRRPKVAKLRAKGNLDGLVEALTHVDLVLARDARGHDVGAQVRVDAADALGDAAPDTGVVAALTQALSDLDERVRIAAARSLGRLSHDAAVEPLARALATGDDAVRDEALKALVEIGDAQAAVVYALTLVERRKVDSLAGAERSALKALLNLGAVGVIIGVAAVVQRMLPPGYQLTAGDTPAIEQAVPQPPPLPAPRPRRRTRVQRLLARLAEGGQ